jgi:hypothetical protein
LEPEVRDWLERLPTERFAKRQIERARRAFRRCVAERHTVDEYSGSEHDG